MGGGEGAGSEGATGGGGRGEKEKCTREASKRYLNERSDGCGSGGGGGRRRTVMVAAPRRGPGAPRETRAGARAIARAFPPNVPTARRPSVAHVLACAADGPEATREATGRAGLASARGAGAKGIVAGVARETNARGAVRAAAGARGCVRGVRGGDVTPLILNLFAADSFVIVANSLALFRPRTGGLKDKKCGLLANGQKFAYRVRADGADLPALPPPSTSRRAFSLGRLAAAFPAVSALQTRRARAVARHGSRRGRGGAPPPRVRRSPGSRRGGTAARRASTRTVCPSRPCSTARTRTSAACAASSRVGRTCGRR